MLSKGIGRPAGPDLKSSEAETVRGALAKSRWNITAAAKTLGIGRNTLYRKIREFGLREGEKGGP